MRQEARIDPRYETETDHSSETWRVRRQRGQNASKCYLEVPVPPGWYGKADAQLNETLTFEQAQEALGTADIKRAVALMKQIDERLGIDADVQPGIRESPAGTQIVLMQRIRTPIDAERLRYIAALKAQSMFDLEPGRNPDNRH